MIVKRENMVSSMIKIGNFPHLKGLDDFDFSFQPQPKESQIRNLATALEILTTKQRASTYFIKYHDLIQNLKKAQFENKLNERIKHYVKYKILIIDKLGYLPLQLGNANLLFQLVDQRYEKHSTIVTTNIEFEE